MKRLSKSKLDGKVSMFVGMDLHKNYLQIAVMNNEGRVLRNSKIDNNLKQISGFFDDIDDKAHVVMESSSVYNIYRYLSEERSFNLILSNPVKTRAIASAKIKTDKLPYEIFTYLPP